MRFGKAPPTDSGSESEYENLEGEVKTADDPKVEGPDIQPEVDSE